MSPNHGVGVGAWHRRRWPGVIAVQIGAPRRYDEKERSGARVWLAMLVAESGPAGDAERSAERLEFRIIFFGVADAKLMMS